MSIAILIGVHDGLVLAADSATSLLVTTPQGPSVANVYDNANKIFNLYKGRPIGCVVFGAGSIGNASVGTIIKDLRAKLMEKDSAREFDFDPDKYSMEQVAGIVAAYLGVECAKIQNPLVLAGTNLGILLGGYSSKESLGESWKVEIRGGKPIPPARLRPNDQPGIHWGGQTEILQRMVLGYSPGLFQILAETTAPPRSTKEEMAAQLGPLLTARLQAQIVFAPMPIQDAIDLAEFLVHSSIMFSRFVPGAQVVGGPIEIAAITKHEQFKWISRKHYYDKHLNREPIHVICD
jgi:hypothetical protein